jgi:hypothetical protein
MFCIAMLDMDDEESDSVTDRLMSLCTLCRFETGCRSVVTGADAFLAGTLPWSSNACPPSFFGSLMVLCAWLGTSSSICVKPVSVLPKLVPLICLEDVALRLELPSLLGRFRSLLCFRFRPCRRLMIMSRIFGRYASKLCGDAGWLRVSSSMVRSRSGTGPKSDVSTPIELNARQARLNS